MFLVLQLRKLLVLFSFKVPFELLSYQALKPVWRIMIVSCGRYLKQTNATQAI